MKLFVGRLPYEMTEENLRELFEKVGAVASAKVVMDRYTGRSRGFGFVEMESQDDAKKAMDELDGSEVMGRSIVVKKANEGDREGGGGGGGRPPRSGGPGGERRGPPRR
jgi:RNA recognition motif-containing protein